MYNICMNEYFKEHPKITAATLGALFFIGMLGFTGITCENKHTFGVCPKGQAWSQSRQKCVNINLYKYSPNDIDGSLAYNGISPGN